MSSPRQVATTQSVCNSKNREALRGSPSGGRCRLPQSQIASSGRASLVPRGQRLLRPADPEGTRADILSLTTNPATAIRSNTGEQSTTCRRSFFGPTAVLTPTIHQRPKKQPPFPSSAFGRAGTGVHRFNCGGRASAARLRSSNFQAAPTPQATTPIQEAPSQAADSVRESEPT